MAEAPTTEITFEAGYEELKEIVAALDREDVTVHEMCEHFARGKGLEKALREYLEAHRGKLTEIEEGQHIPEFRIIASSEPEEGYEIGGDVPADTGDFEPASSSSASTRASDDDIPFASDDEIPF